MYTFTHLSRHVSSCLSGIQVIHDKVSSQFSHLTPSDDDDDAAANAAANSNAFYCS